MSARLRCIPKNAREERLFDLLYTRAMQPLTDEEQRELDALVRESPDIDTDCYDRAAAAIDLHCRAGRVDAMPRHVRERILAVAPSRNVERAQERSATPSHRPRSNSALAMWSGWIVAAAASIVAISALSSRPTNEREPSAAERRVQLVSEARDVITLPFKSTDDPHGKGVSGDLVWSPSRQQGFMRFRGLPTNDPKASQYQLWIFDKPRGTDHPVDGGVFDVAVADGEAIVPIDAKIRVFEPAMFAVTEEAPGGVVVSKREHIVALATF